MPTITLPVVKRTSALCPGRVLGSWLPGPGLTGLFGLPYKRHPVAILGDVGKAEGPAVHYDPDTGAQKVAGEKCFGDILNGVSIAELVRSHCPRQNNGLVVIGKVGLQVLARRGERVRSVDHDDRVVLRHGGPDSVQNGLSIGIVDVEGVFGHDRNVPDLKAVVTESAEDMVKYGSHVGERTIELVVGFLDGSAGGEDSNSIQHLASTCGRGCPAQLFFPLAVSSLFILHEKE